MKFNYYTALLEEARRIEKDLGDFGDKEKPLHDRWRDDIMDRLYTDFLPPIERRDLLSLVQNMGYIAYEVREVVRSKSITSAEGLLLLEKLKKAMAVFVKETEQIRHRKCSATALRKAVYDVLSCWRECVSSGGDKALLDGIESASEALLKYADTLETVCMLN